MEQRGDEQLVTGQVISINPMKAEERPSLLCKAVGLKFWQNQNCLGQGCSNKLVLLLEFLIQ